MPKLIVNDAPPTKIVASRFSTSIRAAIEDDLASPSSKDEKIPRLKNIVHTFSPKRLDKQT